MRGFFFVFGVRFFLVSYTPLVYIYNQREGDEAKRKTRGTTMKLGEIKSHDSIQENHNGVEGIFLRRTFSQCLSKFQNPAEVSVQIVKQTVLPAGFAWGDVHASGRGCADSFALVINDKMEIACDQPTLAAAIRAAEAAEEMGLVEFLKGAV